MMAEDEHDRRVLERQAERLKGSSEQAPAVPEAAQHGKEDSHGGSPAPAPSTPVGAVPGTPPVSVSGTLVSPTTPAVPPVRGADFDAEDDLSEWLLRPHEALTAIPEENLDDHDGIPELNGEDSDDGMSEIMADMFPATPQTEEPEPEEPQAKRSRLAHIERKERALEELANCINMLNDLKKKNDVKEIMKMLEKSEAFELPKNRRQRRTMNCQGKHDISEVYSPPRITKMARKMGLRAGWALDLTQVDSEDGQPWDFSVKAKRVKALHKLKQDEPMMLIVSPMCGPFSALQSLFNYPKQEYEQVRGKLRDAMEHVKFCLELCLEQYVQGRLFLFEHPAGAASWAMQAMQQMRQLDGVSVTKFDFCMLGMKTKDKDGNPRAAQKRTAVMTNSSAITLLLREAQCRAEHTHTQLLGGRAGPCQEYTDEFCRLVCEGVKREKDTLRWKCHMQEAFDITRPIHKLLSIQQKLEKFVTPPEESWLYRDVTFIDDVTGAVLDKAEAIKARVKEMQFFKKMGVYTKVPREAHMKIISTKWLDVNKGDATKLNIRARLVGRELARDKRDDLFAATPPLESLRMILSICADHQGSVNPAENFVVMSNDVSRAYFYAPTTRPIYITIPDEDWEPGDEGRVAKLNFSLYGTRDAAMNWAKRFTDVMVAMGFVRGKASPCNFFHPLKNISTTVHGDDFTSTGREADLKWFEEKLKEQFDIKSEMLGPNVQKHAQEIRVLNRVLGWTASGITYEADPRHAEILIKELSPGTCRPAATPGSREDVGKASAVIIDAAGALQNTAEGLAGPLLTSAEATKFRGLAARANYLAQDRMDIQFAVKEIARRMASPRQGDMALLTRLAKYLAGAPRVTYCYAWQSSVEPMEAFVDSDWAGCVGSRRSTSGGILARGSHILKTWSTTQATVVLSSAEAELYSLVRGAAQALGMLALGQDLGIWLNATVYIDAAATLCIIQRQGLGKLRHVATQFLWVQDKVRNNAFDIAKVPGQQNPADILTKNVPNDLIKKHCEALGVLISRGRARIAPQLSSVEGDHQGGTSDAWERSPTQVIRTHRKPRFELFTPLRVSGAPPGKALTPQRTTRGVYVATGQDFIHTDTWTSRADAHKDLGAMWIGTTEFTYRSGWLKAEKDRESVATSYLSCDGV